MATQPTPIDVDYRLEGPPGAPVLVLSHALGLSLAMWDPQMARLSRALRVVRYDHRGHGGSPVPAGPYRIEDLGRDLLHLLDRLALERVAFCGLSLGGMVGLWIAANAPDRVDRLVVFSAAARMARPQDYADRARQVRNHGMASVADLVIRRWFTTGFAARRPEIIASVRALLVSTPAEGYASACEAVASMDLGEDLPRIGAPTLIVAAAEDQATPPEQSREIARRIPSAEVVVIAGASHLANVEQPEAVTEQILDHVAAG
jgi:3-oxoadipate enol-lactonase